MRPVLVALMGLCRLGMSTGAQALVGAGEPDPMGRRDFSAGVRSLPRKYRAGLSASGRALSGGLVRQTSGPTS